MTSLLAVLSLEQMTPGVRFFFLALAIVPGVCVIVCARAIARWLEHHTGK